MAKKNIFEIHRDNCERVPFVVRREGWSNCYGLLVTSVIPKQCDTGLYGQAQGFALPSLNGERASYHWGFPGKPKSIFCAGCYQWVRLGDKGLPSVWERYICEFLDRPI